MTPAPLRAKKPTFRPWAGQLKLGIIFAALGVLSLAAGWDQGAFFLTFGTLALVIGLGALGHAFARINGKRIEQRAIQSVRLPPGWISQPNVKLLGGGDLDLLIVSPDGRRFAIEIKSHKGVKRQRGLFGLGSDKLLRINGRKLDRDPVGQIDRGARLVQGSPVLWFPNVPWTMIFSSELRFVLKNGVLVVQGNERQLRRAIGASRSWAL